MRAAANSQQCTVCGTKLLPNDRFCSGCGERAEANASSHISAGGTAASDGLMERVRRATIGRYDIHSELGRGGMAVVYLAYELALQRKVAIKVMLPELFLSEGMAERFMLEARTAARLAHPNIVVIHTVSSVDDLFYFDMRLVEGGALDDILKVKCVLPLDESRWILSRAARALAYAHGEGVIHRDVKPGNIMINTGGDVVLTDFGIAKASESPNLTRTGTAVGTPAYMSPEQALVTRITSASDQYSLGIVAYELFAGHPPFRGSALEVQWAQAHYDAPELIEVAPHVPSGIAATVMRMLSKKPEKRWPSLTDVEDIFEDRLPSGPAHPRFTLAARAQAAQQILSDSLSPTPRSPVPRSARAVAPTNRPSARQETLASTARSLAIDVTRTETFEMQVLEVGQSIELAFDDDTAAPDVQFICSDSSIIDVDADGIVHARRAGRALVTVVFGRQKTVMPFHVRTPVRVPTRLVLSNDALQLETGETVALSVSAGSAQDDALFTLATPAIWRTSNADVVTCTDSGQLTAVRIGRATVHAELGELSAACQISVFAAAVSRIAVDERAIQLAVRDTRNIEARALDRREALTEATFSYDSENTAIARVDENGCVEARAPGRTAIVIRAGEARTTLELTVVAASVARVSVSPAAISLEAGESATLTATAYDMYDVGLSGREFAWSSGDDRIVRVSDSGAVSAVGVGDSVVTVTCAGVRQQVRIAVAPVPLKAIAITPSEVAVVMGRSVKLAVSATDMRGGTAISPQVSWTVTDGAVASVENGVVQARHVGTTTITARAGAFAAHARVVVSAPVAVRVEIIQSNARLRLNETAKFSAEVQDSDGVVIPDVAVLWMSSDDAVVWVDDHGTVQSRGVGVASISAVAGALRSSVDVQVLAPRKLAVLPFAIGGVLLAAGGAAILLLAQKDSTGGSPGEAAGGDSIASTPPASSVTPAIPRTFSRVAMLINGRAAMTRLTLRMGQQVRVEARAVGSDGTDSVLTVRSTNYRVVAFVRGALVAKAAGVAEIVSAAPGVRGNVVITVQELPAVVAGNSEADAAALAAADSARLAAQTQVVVPTVPVLPDKPVIDSVVKAEPVARDTVRSVPVASARTAGEFGGIVLTWLVERRESFEGNADLAKRMKKLDFWKFDQEGGFSIVSVTGVAGDNATVRIRFPSTDNGGNAGFVTATLRIRLDGRTVTHAPVIGVPEFQRK